MNDAAPLNRYQLAELGSLLAEPARAAMLLVLMDGSARPAGELAQAAGVGAATASAHLKRLLDGGLLGVHAQGRHRYYRLADDDVAAWLETMALPRAARPLRIAATDPALCRARTCYRHLAGELGVALCAAWLESGWLQSRGDGLRLQPLAVDALRQAGWPLPVTERLLRLRGRACGGLRGDSSGAGRGREGKNCPCAALREKSVAAEGAGKDGTRPALRRAAGPRGRAAASPWRARPRG